MKDFINYVVGNDDSELAKVKAERDYALHCLERELAIGQQLQEQLVKAREALEGARDAIRAHLIADAVPVTLGRIDHVIASITDDLRQPANYCQFCDLEHVLHEDAKGFHHVVKGERVACTSAQREGE